MLISYKFRIKDKGVRKQLEAHARSVSFVWNYCCEVQRKAESNWRAGLNLRRLSRFDLTKLTSGTSIDLGIHSDTIGEICRYFTESRNAKGRCPKFRRSFGTDRSLGWVPLKGRFLKVTGDVVSYLGRNIRFWKSRDLPSKPKTAAFTEDARGRWYVSFTCEVESLPTGAGQVGIDLGLKTLATCSDGTTVPALQHYRKYQAALGKAQRAKSKRRVAAIHAKIANARKHHLHEQSSRIARENKLIVVGDVSSSKLAKTTMAKSVMDVSWFMFKQMLRYKSARRQAVFVEVNEAYTSRTCSCCGTIPDSSPKGTGALGIRSWVCSDCGEVHDRDLNAARNILRIGLERQPLVEGIAALAA